jgi:hypothetical protein
MTRGCNLAGSDKMNERIAPHEPVGPTEFLRLGQPDSTLTNLCGNRHFVGNPGGTTVCDRVRYGLITPRMVYNSDTMERLVPDWNQEPPTYTEISPMCRRIVLTAVPVTAAPFQDVLESLRYSHVNGGAFLSAFRISPDKTFDWFASRSRLMEHNILTSILSRSEVRESVSALMIPDPEHRINPSSGPSTDAHDFSWESPFLFDGRLAGRLYSGGAYTVWEGDGRAEKQLALDFCEAAFARRFGDLASYVNDGPWTPWFHGMGYDWTSVLFDKELRNLWILAVTDTD